MACSSSSSSQSASSSTLSLPSVSPSLLAAATCVCTSCGALAGSMRASGRGATTRAAKSASGGGGGRRAQRISPDVMSTNRCPPSRRERSVGMIILCSRDASAFGGTSGSKTRSATLVIVPRLLAACGSSTTLRPVGPIALADSVCRNSALPSTDVTERTPPRVHRLRTRPRSPAPKTLSARAPERTTAGVAPGARPPTLAFRPDRRSRRTSPGPVKIKIR